MNCVIPGLVLVPDGDDDSVLAAIEAALPIGHIGNPGNIADACIFLVNNNYTTGTTLRVDGGEGLAGGEI